MKFTCIASEGPVFPRIDNKANDQQPNWTKRNHSNIIAALTKKKTCGQFTKLSLRDKRNREFGLGIAFRKRDCRSPNWNCDSSKTRIIFLRGINRKFSIRFFYREFVIPLIIEWSREFSSEFWRFQNRTGKLFCRWKFCEFLLIITLIFARKKIQIAVDKCRFSVNMCGTCPFPFPSSLYSPFLFVCVAQQNPALL